jgi:hypothetical protein
LLSPESVFKECLFRVPDYQRGYAWERRQRDELLEDLELLPAGKAHYTGNLVLHAVRGRKRVTDKRGNSYVLLDIVDGQQRLTTIILLLDAIRAHLLTEGQDDLAEGLTEGYISIIDPNGEPKPKLILNRDCHQFFLERVVIRNPPVAGPTIRSHQNIADACQEFREYLEAKKQELGDQFLQWLMCLREKTCQQLLFTAYLVDDAAEVGVIFEVMNNRGLQITELEKVKNYLLYLSSKLEVPAEHDLATLVNHTWTHIFESLMSSGLNDAESENRLLRMHWLMAYDYSPKNWKKSKSVKDTFHLRKYVDRNDELLRDLREYVLSLRDATTVFCDIENPGRTGAFGAYSEDLRQRAARAGEKLKRLGVLAAFTPLLMAVRLRFPEGGDAYLKALDLCEKFSFRVYALLEHRADTARTTFFMLGQALFVEAGKLEQTLGLVAGLIHQYSPDGEFNRKWELAEERNWYDWRGLKYLLYEYEDDLAARRPVQISWSLIERDLKRQTIEHILPRNPEPEGYWADHFTAADRQKYTNDIGNLCLTFDNSRYWRKPFPDKKGKSESPTYCYANGTLFMERGLAQYDDWTAEAVVRRRDKIIAWAKRRWEAPPLSGQPSAVEEAPDEGQTPGEEADA